MEEALDTVDLILWGIALLVSVAFGIVGIRAYNKRSQSQKTDRGSIGIQAGGSVRIGDERKAEPERRK